MQSILRWSLENSTPMDSAASDRPPPERKDLNPAIIDLILGKPDSEQMKEDMAVALDASKSEDARIAALDHLEMLIEQIDNANDLEKLKLWEPLQSLLTTESSTTELKTQSLWVIGTAVQNNPSAQEVYLSYDPLPVLLSFLEPSPPSSATVRSKAIYALSGLLQHNFPALEELGKPEVDGWTKLRNALQDPALSVRRKAIFLLSSLLVPNAVLANVPAQSDTTNILFPDRQPSSAARNDPIFANSHSANLQNPSRSNTSHQTVMAAQEHKILDAVIIAVISPLPHGNDGENIDPDPDFEEKAVHFLFVYAVACQGELSEAHKDKLKVWIQSEKQKEGEKQLLEKWNLSREEYAAFIGKLL